MYLDQNTPSSVSQAVKRQKFANPAQVRSLIQDQQKIERKEKQAKNLKRNILKYAMGDMSANMRSSNNQASRQLRKWQLSNCNIYSDDA